MDVASGPIVGIQKSGRKVARREGSLVICGKKRAEVFAFKVCSRAMLQGAGSSQRCRHSQLRFTRTERSPCFVA